MLYLPRSAFLFEVRIEHKISFGNEDVRPTRSAAQLFTALNELRRSTFTLADVESRLALHVHALRACRDLYVFVAFNHDR